MFLISLFAIIGMMVSMHRFIRILICVDITFFLNVYSHQINNINNICELKLFLRISQNSYDFWNCIVLACTDSIILMKCAPNFFSFFNEEYSWVAYCENSKLRILLKQCRPSKKVQCDLKMIYLKLMLCLPFFC